MKHLSQRLNIWPLQETLFDKQISPSNVSQKLKNIFLLEASKKSSDEQ